MSDRERGMDPNVTASPPGSPPHFASEEPQGRPRS